MANTELETISRLTDGLYAGPTIGQTLSGILTTGVIGSDTACTNGGYFVTRQYFSRPQTITNLSHLIGSVGGTDKVYYAVWNDAGTAITTSAVAGVTVGTAATFQTAQALLSPITISQPQSLWLGAVFNGTTAKVRTLDALNKIAYTATVAGAFGAAQPTLTPTTSWTTAQGPIFAWS